MALLSQKTGLEKFMGSLDRAETKLIYATAVEELRNNSVDLNKFFSYEMDSEKRLYLTRRGVELFPGGYKAHSHPVSKTLENYILYVLLPVYIGVGRINMVSIQRKKVLNLSLKMNYTELNTFNRIIDSKDISRYGADEDVFNDERKELFSSTFINKFRTSKAYDCIFIHDECHHWSLNDITYFIEEVKPKRMLVSVVYPPELLLGIESSLNKLAYDFEINDDGTFSFYPDGVKTEAYNQRVNLDWLMKGSYLRTNNGVYTIRLLKTLAAHHMFEITKGRFVTDNPRHFEEFECIDLSFLKQRRWRRNEYIFIKKTWLTKVYTYLQCLKKPDKESGLAKLRQIMGEAQDLKVTMFFENLMPELLQGCQKKIFDVSFFEKVVSSFWKLFPITIQRLSSDFKDKNFFEVLFNCENLRVKIKTRSYDSRGIISMAEHKIDDFLEGFSWIPKDYDALVKRSSESHVPSLLRCAGAVLCTKEEARMRGHSDMEGMLACERPPLRIKEKGETSAVEKEGDLKKDIMTRAKDGKEMEACGRSSKEKEKEKEEVKEEAESKNQSVLIIKRTSKNKEEDNKKEREGSEEEIKMMVEVFDDILDIRMTLTNLLKKVLISKRMQLTRFTSRDAHYVVEDIRLDYGHNGIMYKKNLADERVKVFMEKVRETYKGKWNTMLIQRYKKGSSINFHSDDEPMIVKGSSVLTMNVEGSATFRIVKKGNEKKNNKKENHPCSDEFLSLNNFCVFKMKEGFQELFRHSIDVHSEGRMSITFREIKPTFIFKGKEKEDQQEAAKENVDKVGSKLEAESEKRTIEKKKCLLTALATFFHVEKVFLANKLAAQNELLSDWINGNMGADSTIIMAIANSLKMRINVFGDIEKSFEPDGYDIPESKIVDILLENEHFTLLNRSDVLRMSNAQKCLMGLEDRMEVNIKVQGNEFGSHNRRQKLVNNVIEEILDFPSSSEVKFLAKKENALILMKSFLSMSTGICLSEHVHNGKDFMKLSASKREGDIISDLIVVSGFGGSGKSRSLQELIKEKKRGVRFTIISPRKNLAEDWHEKVNSDLDAKENDAEKKGKVKIKTFESALKMNLGKSDIIVLDELSLYPNGYLDLLIHSLSGLNVNMPRLVVIGCPFQARYHSKLDEHILTFDHEIDRIFKGNGAINYLAFSHRLGVGFNCVFEGIECLGESEEMGGSINVFKSFNNAIAWSEKQEQLFDLILVDSREEKKAYSGLINVLTFGEAQGLTVNNSLIVLSENSANSEEFRWVVALTRARRTLSFLVVHLDGIEGFMAETDGKMINALLKGEKVNVKELSKKKGFNLNFIEFNEIKNGGNDEQDRELRLEGDPWLKPFINLHQRENAEEVIVDEVFVREDKEKTHLYLAEPNFSQALNFDLILDKEVREFRLGEEQTNQFTDNYNVNHWGGKRINTAPFRHKAIYPRHEMKDDLTFKMAVKKRLKFEEPAVNYQKYMEARCTGRLMYEHFKETFGIEWNHDQALLEECRNDFEVKKLQKSAETIKCHSNRSDCDWYLNDIFLFMKTQLCTKYEKQFVEAKAGQTLACFQHLLLAHFAPYCRYIEKQLVRMLPDEIYIHSSKNFDELNEWVIRHFQNDICVESDYEAFDASQDQYILAFEMALMKDAGMPDHILDDYLKLKCELGCKLGKFAIMRFTGEFCTFLFNTLANMAFTISRYEWRRGMPIAFAGDDMCSLSNLKVSDRFEDLFDKISLKAKTQWTEEPMFCGWRLSRHGIVKEPELVFNRFMVALEEGKVELCLENYAIEVSYAYRLGEKLYEVLKSERQIEFHQAVVRFIVLHLNKLKTSARELFEEQSSDEELNF
uniref:RNA-dependent RNA polymerase n=1 Tax=Watermelon virus A TaxID=1978413 RepID=A0A5B8TYN2_9VIRU|nr:RNA-dependent RNA polymerase [Watermelon virus A]